MSMTSGDEPVPRRLDTPQRPLPPAQRNPPPARPGRPPVAPRARPTQQRGAGRVVAVVFAVLMFLLAGGLLSAATTVFVADNTLRDNQGFFMSPSQRFSTGAYAIESEAMRLGADGGPDFVPRQLLGEAKLQVTPANGSSVFVGVGRTEDVDAYLAGVEHVTLVDFTSRGGVGVPRYVKTPGKPPGQLPRDSTIWVAQASGTGGQTVTWPLQSGAWKVVMMNTDGSRNVAADVAVGATFPDVDWVIGALVLLGVGALALSAVLLYVALRTTRRHQAQALT